MKKFKCLAIVLAFCTMAAGLSACFGFLPKNADLSAMFAKYADRSDWNFAVELELISEGNLYTEYYEYLGENVSQTYESKTDYYSLGEPLYYYYMDNGDGSYSKYDENTNEFEEAFSYANIVNLDIIGQHSFKEDGGVYKANDPVSTGNDVIGVYTGHTWNAVNLYIEQDTIVKIIATMDDGYIFRFGFSKYGSVNFTLPTPGTPVPKEVMEKQNYDPYTFDSNNLQDKRLAYEGAIGLPSTGNINALVIPVQFKGDLITQNDLKKLDTAFNGTEEATGWESVKTYYQKASYGKLNLSFDIQPVYQAKSTANYYETFKEIYYEGDEAFKKTGEELILEEALSYYESRLDLTKYDSNGDNAIDAVYLIYSAPVDYDADSFYWAYVTWYYQQKQWDGKDAFFYLFAGIDFMDEDVGSNGMKVNASTYIHETGHLLGLDDYYDYDTKNGCNEGLGGADMMDYTVGDHNVYSKIMLGWLKPEIVTTTSTFTIGNTQEIKTLLIPLNFDNSYFCEYLLVDLYTNDGLNEKHSQMPDTVLYDGAQYGVRIYHVSSSVNNPFSDKYGSFTDNNNSLTKIPLLKLVEADGEKRFASTGGNASASDLWTTGDRLSSVFPEYTRHDRKLLNFDISIGGVTQSSAIITVTFKN